MNHTDSASVPGFGPWLSHLMLCDLGPYLMSLYLSFFLYKNRDSDNKYVPPRVALNITNINMFLCLDPAPGTKY